MARPLRRQVADGWYHVFGRGLERRLIFADVRDRAHFLELLAEMHARFQVRIHAYALMDNHYHAILQTPLANLSQALQWMHGSYASWFNARHQRVGPLYQGRYRAIPVENGEWAYALSQYVHLNPVRVAGLGLDRQGRLLEGRGFQTPTREEATERLRRLRASGWSSYRAYAGYEPAPVWLETADLLRRADRDTRRAAKRYRAELRERLTRGVAPAHLEGLADAVALGSASFRRTLRETAVAAAGQDRGIVGRRLWRRQRSLEDVQHAMEQVTRRPWKDLWEERRGWVRPLFWRTARRWCGTTLRELGAAGGVSHAAVSMAIRRWNESVAKDEERRQLQDMIERMLHVTP